MKKKTDWIVMRGNRFQCLHCGQKYEMAMPLDINMFVAMSKSFEKSHRKCQCPATGLRCTYCLTTEHPWDKCPLLFPATVEEWLRGPDVGESAKTVCRFMRGMFMGEIHTPRDPDDFGRCYRLLRAFPDWRTRVGEMSTLKGWEHLATSWEKLTALYEEELPTGKAPKLYALIKELTL